LAEERQPRQGNDREAVRERPGNPQRHVKTSEALGQLAKGSFEAANENFTKQVNVAKKAAK
jgi:hypothetical protein